jgi:outer membrane protein TolC
MRMLPLILGSVLFLFPSLAQGQPRQLRLSDAIQAALENNANVQITEELQVQASARAKEQRAVLLPNVNGTAGYVNQTINLGARGIRFPGFPIPATVGPFGTFDVRAQFTEPVLDLSLIRRYQSARRSADATEFDTAAVRNRVAAMVAGLYFGVQRGRALVDSAKAQTDLDQNLLKLARDRSDAGVGTALDVTRAESRLAADQHRLLQAQNDARTAELRLLRAMGERPGEPLDLADSITTSLLTADPVETAISAALKNRPEIKAEETRVEAARIASRGSSAERLPTIQAFADYGNNGNREVFVPTNSVGLQLQIPLFDGGRRAAHRTTAESQQRQADIRARDLRDEIEFDVRVAVDNLASAREQLRAADQALKLAQDELELARLRFEAQVTTQIDVVNAQTQLADARSRQVNAAYVLKSAEIEYQRATGVEIR